MQELTNSSHRPEHNLWNTLESESLGASLPHLCLLKREGGEFPSSSGSDLQKIRRWGLNDRKSQWCTSHYDHICWITWIFELWMTGASLTSLHSVWSPWNCTRQPVPLEKQNRLEVSPMILEKGNVQFCPRWKSFSRKRQWRSPLGRKKSRKKTKVYKACGNFGQLL